jgi:hypothetical protein
MIKNFRFSTSSCPAQELTQPPYAMGIGCSLLEVKWPGREADHSPPTSAEVKKMWIHTTTPPYMYV